MELIWDKKTSKRNRVTRKNLMQRAQPLSIDHLQVFLDLAPTALLAVTRQGNVVFSNKLAQSYFLYSQEELKDMPIDKLIPSSFRANHLHYLQQYFADPKPRAMGVGRKLSGLRKSGDAFPIEIGLNPIDIGDAKLVIASILDITERRRLEQRYEAAIQQLPEGMLIVCSEGRIVMANPTVEQMFGYGRNELIGQPVEVLLPTRTQDAHHNHRNMFMANPSARRMGMGFDLYGRRKDGSEIPVEIGLNPMSAGDGLEVIVTIIDISNRRKLESQRHEFEAKIQQTQKLESLGMLAGGIAHDFNNILTGVLGNAELALMGLPRNSGVTQNIERILEAAHRAAELCHQMLAYTGKNKFIQKAFSLNEIIETTAELIHASVSKNALMKFSLQPDLPAIVGDPTQMRQVIMNLVINASEAINQPNGLISIITGVIDYDPSQDFGYTPYESEVPAGRYAHLTVSDTGQGIDPKVLDKIFEPFFSTKFTGRGLGLAAVLGIIRAHGGTITIYTEIGRGTTFRILLPYQDTQVAVEENLKLSRRFSRSGRIMIIDDEQRVHQVIGDTLLKAGFDVVSALDGRDGLRMFESEHQQLALVILDLTMPYMNGDEVYRCLRQVNTRVPVIITSGYSEEEISEQFIGKGIAGFLHKPVSPSGLLELVHQVLERPALTT
jgi:two-component system cell cycle sensor histidine kinase/response regulator CckA